MWFFLLSLWLDFVCMSVCVSVITFVFTAPSYKQPFANNWLSEKACWTNRWRTCLFYLGIIFLTFQEEALLLLWFHLSSSHKLCVRLKNSPVLCLWLLWATPRFPKGTLSCISAVRGAFLEAFEKLPYQGQLYWYVDLYITWSEKFRFVTYYLGKPK